MEKGPDHGKHRYGMVIDLDKCTGCGTCAVACAAENNVSVRQDESDKERSISWMQIFKITNGKPYPDTEVSYFPRPCMHCEEDGHGHHTSPCVTVCVATATKLDPNSGIVSQIYTRCIGCRYCQAACPYKARYFNWWDAYFPKGKGLDRYLTPEVSPRMRGVVEKCTFCHHRLMRAKTRAYAEDRREIEEDEYITACTEACPAQAITFGDLNNPKHRVSRLAKSPNAFRLLERLNTKPKVYYLSTKDWVRKLADNYLPDEFKPLS
ncbi:MAG: 4Fe-4S dicluster domain-containing protein [Deltaproteobacteria bacterium]|nr:4Fe-4S dicluster domain-containing protein [Deltaproteobacteria bacterium]MBW1925162.1 4Fe-4S dicluster domain-containing protein [Deltaproteobacteria bacterium]MBW1950818.1 4Fe-4S dicluster domain-containing protein [Deltaproteobacteria bacterium]MBW2008673.1 4Fe-4S dicluster domain-containing protein [Deltaproteobacteria bacterium]MBW2102886.1 4Fe-4S dicluster domain-containing protein [Deltaproteobacteria bacterium]